MMPQVQLLSQNLVLNIVTKMKLWLQDSEDCTVLIVVITYKRHRKIAAVSCSIICRSPPAAHTYSSLTDDGLALTVGFMEKEDKLDAGFCVFFHWGETSGRPPCHCYKALTGEEVQWRLNFGKRALISLTKALPARTLSLRKSTGHPQLLSFKDYDDIKGYCALWNNRVKF